jgi:hypothetical protein
MLLKIVEVIKYSGLLVRAVAQNRNTLMQNVGLPLSQVYHCVSSKFTTVRLQDEHLYIESRVVGTEIELRCLVDVADSVNNPAM